MCANLFLGTSLELATAYLLLPSLLFLPLFESSRDEGKKGENKNEIGFNLLESVENPYTCTFVRTYATIQISVAMKGTDGCQK